jgi:hypothetical protein
MPPAVADSPSLTYYTEQIRSEIIATVLALKHKLENKRYADEYAPLSPVRAEYVRLGYLLNTVGVNEVEFASVYEELVYDEDDEPEYVDRVRHEREDLYEQSVW